MDAAGCVLALDREDDVAGDRLVVVALLARVLVAADVREAREAVGGRVAVAGRRGGVAVVVAGRRGGVAVVAHGRDVVDGVALPHHLVPGRVPRHVVPVRVRVFPTGHRGANRRPPGPKPDSALSRRV